MVVGRGGRWGGLGVDQKFRPCLTFDFELTVLVLSTPFTGHWSGVGRGRA